MIFISGYGNDETVARALELGAADYIVKPFSPTELVAWIRAALRRRGKTNGLEFCETHIVRKIRDNDPQLEMAQESSLHYHLIWNSQ